MPVESPCAFIPNLDPTSPSGPEGISQGDDHLRNIKTAVKGSFPNFTGAAVTGTEAQLNVATGAFNDSFLVVPHSADNTRSGTVTLRGKTGSQDVGLTNTSDGGAQLARFNVDGSSWAQLASISPGGDISATGKLMEAGNALIPRGTIVMWWGSLSAIPAGWVLCNGSNGTPNLLDRFPVAAGYSYALGATGGVGVASANTGSAGGHSHTTDTQGDHTHGGYTDTQGYHAHGGNTQGHALTIQEMPAHSHGYVTVNNGTGIQPGSGLANVGGTTDSAGNGWAHTHGISGDGNHAHNITLYNAGAHAHNVNAVGDHQHYFSIDTRSPYMALGFIMKT